MCIRDRFLSAHVPINTYIPNPRYLPSSSSIVPPLGYIPDLPRAFSAAPKGREEKTGGRGRGENGAREKVAGGGQGAENKW
eukprot:72913-Pyramimonas_sp.AAC.1